MPQLPGLRDWFEADGKIKVVSGDRLQECIQIPIFMPTRKRASIGFLVRVPVHLDMSSMEFTGLFISSVSRDAVHLFLVMLCGCRQNMCGLRDVICIEM